ncbi:hypothetical protein E1A91_A03G088000v1 [Gossypium mustelinum]|uniref:C3H1-type domain-containing protein n=1 Tax=Gossypium mustelinum TaxID=34275 RepID=A0A5D2ZY07_GOSMU|nr:hypothetical protein E1A91_A03G088000v1 [Gossypium mustelinum]
MNQMLEGRKSQCDISDNMLNEEEKLRPPQMSTGCSASILPENTSAAGSSSLGEQGQEGITKVDQLAFEASVSEVNLVKLTVRTKQPIVTSLEKSNTSDQLAKGGCPFRLLQDYTSDDNSEKDIETGIGNMNAPFGASLENASSPNQTGKGFGPLSNMPYKVASSEVVEGTITTSIMNENEHADHKDVQKVSRNHAASVEVLQKENVMVGDSVESIMFSEEHREEEENLTLGSQHKVDKFGRLARNDGSDSDSDDSDYVGRHRRGRTRSRSQSRSPPDRRKRRSPRRTRRREKRSLSRSWSPRNQRSRSRSPRNRRSRSRSPRNHRSRSRSPRNRRSRSRSPRNRRSRSRSPYLRRADEFSAENKRRAKGQMQFCFDFRRGRCYRGVSCRFLHHDSGKSDESRWQKSKQQLEFPHNSRTNIRDEVKRISEKVADHEHGEVRGPEVKPYGNFVASRDRSTNLNIEDSVGGGILKQDDQSTEYHMVKCEESRDIPASVSETHLVEDMKEGPNLVTTENCQEAAVESHHLSTVNAVSVGDTDKLNSSGHASQKILISFKKPVDQKSLSRTLDPVSQNADCLHQQSDTNQRQAASSMSHSSGESFPSYMLPDQQSYFALQPKSSLASLPPPPPLKPLDSTITPGVSSHFRQSHLPLRNDFGSETIPRPYPTELPAHSQSDGFQQRAYIPIQEANRPVIHTSLPVSNLPIQQLGAPSKSGDDGLTHPPTQNVFGSNSFAQGNTYPHAMPISQQFLGNKMQPFPGESLPPGGLSNSSSYIHPYPQQQQPPHSLHHPMADRIYNPAGKMNSSLKDPPDIKDATSHHIDIGGSTTSTFPNQHAPTLDQPINFKYHSHVLQEKGTTYNNTHFSLGHAPVDGRRIGLQEATSPPNSARAIGQNSSRSGDSGILLGLSDSNKPLDMEEKAKDAGAVTSAASADNEEFGETADAEVGAVENGSPSHPVEVNMAAGEIEMDQIKSPGKSKKSKDSRSMKLFKVAIADFVKEVLKPSWQQGNMSKEAFKTIVKKTVDKVSGAMKNHQIPKSRAKIDHYIESSQRKLTKLVMGYVDKYVKV